MNKGCGIEVYYSNNKDVRNIVFFPDGTYKYYDTGGMLFELISDEAIYLTTEKALNIIRIFPEYNKPLSRENLAGGIDWLFCAIDDDELPVAAEVFRSGFIKAVNEVTGTDDSDTSCQSVGEFLETCYEVYVRYEQSFSAFCVALAEDASGTADGYNAGLAKLFKEEADGLYQVYTRKCSVRHKDGMASVETHNISSRDTPACTI